MNTLFQATYIEWHITFLARLSRKGSKKILYFAMPATGRDLDLPVTPRAVPLHIRRAAKEYLIQKETPCTTSNR